MKWAACVLLIACTTNPPPPIAPVTPHTAPSQPAPSEPPPSAQPVVAVLPSPSPEPESVVCKTDDDCWVDDNHAPIARPKKLRGKKFRPCKDGEHVPSCRENACIVRAAAC